MTIDRAIEIMAGSADVDYAEWAQARKMDADAPKSAWVMIGGKAPKPMEVEKYYMLVVYDRIGNFVKRKPVYGDNPDIEDEVKSLIFPLTGEKYDVKVETRYRRVRP